jgi:hypothetical protein
MNHFVRFRSIEMKFMTAYLAAILSAGVMSQVKADETAPVATTTTVAPVPVAAATEKADAFALDFSAQTDFYNFDDGLVVITPSAGFELFEVLDATVSLPVYNDTEVTGIGDLDFNVEYSLLQTKQGLLWSDSSSLALNGGFGLPLGGDYSSDNMTFTFGGEFGFDWGKIAFDQTASYLVNTGGEVYVPTFGGFIEENVFSATSSLSYNFTKSFSVGMDFSQFYAGDAQYLSVGPTVGLDLGKTTALDLSVGFPVDQQNMPYGDCDFTVSAGLAFKF